MEERVAVLERKREQTEGDRIAYQDTLIDTRERVVNVEYGMARVKEVVEYTRIRLDCLETEVAGVKSIALDSQVRLGNLERDVSGLKQDVSGLKQGVSGLTRSVDAIVSHFGIVLPAEEARP
ncbi:hypothetical protein [Nocardia brasiliensis]|uniref:hypothetical protein n=1 Tax=Nocardia brasiliensis TaxID=37326 RepID=UPI002458C2B9|nr:hypothetical protein [Nocardia brasiliensis]